MEPTFPMTAGVHTSAKPRRSKIIDTLMDELDFALVYNGGSASGFRAKLESLSDSTIDMIGATASWLQEHGISRYQLLYPLVSVSNEQLVREVLFHRPHFTGKIETSTAIQIINGLHYLDRFKKTGKLDELSSRDLAIAKAILNVTAALHEHAAGNALIDEMGEGFDEDAIYIFNLDLVDLISEHHDKAPQMVAFVKEYGTDDDEHMLSYITNHDALRVGTL